MRSLALSALAAMACGCANVNYETTRAGTFTGEVAVVWLRGTDKEGDGTFVYVPTEAKPLTFTRPDKTTVIQPTMIYTDGGSVPSLARAFRGLTPWNYGPAYIVHDWLFRAKQCWEDGKKRPKYAVVADMSFAESAMIIAESIHALHDSKRVRNDDISGAVVTAAVTSPISYRRWTQKGACEEVSDAHRRMALEAVGRDPELGSRSKVRTLRGREDGPPEPTQAVVVAITSFD
ncbi:DUF1353 domain-containing protein [Tabrizicola sp.]|uniref:DUF1353 domain-containing protein n=1 Tax=Tabrizicola sp. TaxID=2005166 RepID=UPI001A395484|nr:DUF1353 domain-containing protein [Tabrizicola sp.]MBL9072387.1 DUF1353 domain-containing protein [Tabrizicola sp.]